MIPACDNARRYGTRNTMPPLSIVGTARGVVVPSPSWPELLRPQQNAAPELVSPQVCCVPVISVVKTCPPKTATGTRRGVVVPSPSEPSVLNPQQ